MIRYKEELHNILHNENVFMLEMRIEDLEKASRPRRSAPLRNSLPRSPETQSCEDRSQSRALDFGTWRSVVCVELRRMRNRILLFISLL